jgi:hypothetical protein
LGWCFQNQRKFWVGKKWTRLANLEDRDTVLAPKIADFEIGLVEAENQE